ncbi:PKD domain-containing protein [Pengzhenrongella sp.]|jgi:PKD repeat protein|uniref:PKD domain-containing protein n=1 Tax=Pengzhenrongella sp. TaxID=2888820 RepID=UPI002F94198E
MEQRVWWRLGNVSRVIASFAVTALVVAGLAVVGPSAPALADSAPADPATPTTVAADGLPTVQIDGVAWSQVVVGGTVYVAGQFTTARPAGAAAGTSTVTRSNLLAYDLATGVLISTWKPVLDGPAYVITASLDGTRLYVGGDFTHVNGAAQNRFVVLDRASGVRVAGFTVGANASVRAITSTPTTIYFGGNFNSAGGVTHYRLAAINATTGVLLSWHASAQAAQVEALVLSPDNSRLIVGGRFTTLNNVPALGSGAVSTSTGLVVPWAANAVIKDWGYAAGITSLVTDGTLIYGTGFAFIKDANSAGNLEGVFAANPDTGEIVWVEDCHGDTYSVFANPGGTSVYSVGHVHFCGNVGAYPEGAYRYGLAFAKTTAMTITPNTVANYYDWQGYRAPAQLDYYPDMTKGTFTGQGQAAWHVTGNSDYVVYGGEFLTVNGQAQQGLVRMAVSAHSTNKLGPQLSGSLLQPAAVSRAAGTAQVSWPTNWDKDSETLTYRVLRDGATTPVYTTTGMATSWQLSRLSFTDTGLVNGSVHSYKVVEVDPFGNSVTSPSVSVTVSSAGTQGSYAAGVMAANPVAYWRLGETSGSAQDWTGFADSSVGSGTTRAVPGALSGDTNGAARFAGSPSSRVTGFKSAVGLNRFSLEAWFKTTSTAGGAIVGFGDSSTLTDSTAYDRQVYMGADGRLSFGLNPNSIRVVTTPIAYNDGQWHHVVATLGAAGMNLYVDGAVRAALVDTVSAKVIPVGYWHIAGDSVTGWPNSAGENFAGDIDDVAVYARALTAAEVAVHQSTGSGGVFPNLLPSASFTAAGGVFTAAVDGSASSDPDGTITSYAWDFGDTTTGTGVSATHTYAAAGTYPVTLTVTDNRGGTAATTRQVVVTPPNQPPVASFTATPTGLTLALDATASTDSDGTIASYEWTYGDGGTDTGVTASHVYPAGGTYTVTLTVTDNSGAATTTSQQVLVNSPPTASFTATGGELTASVDAAASTDADGTIASYDWDFGDTTTGTGVSTSHAYATGGTYTLTLTVTDDQGATATTSHPVVVTNPNQPPVASFFATTWGMSASVNAAASTDPDGTVASYAWDFGDGATAVGSSASHVYAAPGAYPIKLTVTDNAGATGTTTQTATFDPAAAGFLAADTFARTLADGFGTADLGGPWTATAGATSVVNGAGQLTLAAASSTAGARLPGVSAVNLTTQVTESWDKRPGGSGGWFTVRGRITTGGEYRLKVGHQASGAVTARVVRTAAGVETGITSEVTVPGVTYTAGTQIVALFQVTGTSPTTLRAKVWASSQAQPSAWFIDTTDTTAALQGAGHTGVAASLSSTTNNGPVVVRVDNYSVTVP